MKFALALLIVTAAFAQLPFSFSSIAHCNQVTTPSTIVILPTSSTAATPTGSKIVQATSIECAPFDPNAFTVDTSGAIPIIRLKPPISQTQTPGPSRHFPNSFFALTEYAPPSTVTAPILNWLAARFDWIVGAGTVADPHGSFPTQVHVQSYTDSAVVYQGQMYDVQALALKNNWALEDMMMHSNQDVQYNVAGGYQKWTQMHQFDAFEKRDPMNDYFYDTSVNGVFTWDGSAYSDVTVSSFAGAPGVGGSPGSITIPATGGLYVGYMEPFDQMNFTIATARVGGAVAYQYWNGSGWATLTAQSDSTTGLTTSGKIYFWPPADWAQTIINGSKSKYWVRVIPVGTWTTAPVYSALFGDDWSVASGSNNARGWASSFTAATGVWSDLPKACPNNKPNGTSCLINAGTRLRYDANPPAGASAHFRYQGRVTDIYYANPNEMYGNPTNIQGGRITWGDWISSAWLTQSAKVGSWCCDSTFLDDVNGLPTYGAAVASPVNVQSGLDFNQNAPYNSIVAAELGQVKTSLSAAVGPRFSLGLNAGSLPAPYVGDISQQEGYGLNTWVPYPVYASASGSNQTYVKMDDLLDYGTPNYVAAGYVNGLNDLTYSGTYTGISTLYCVKITGTAPDTFSVGTAAEFLFFGSCNNISTGNALTGGTQSIGSGLWVTFGSSLGHQVGDLWFWETQNQNRSGAREQFTFWDSTQYWGPGLSASAWHYADLANRTPMTALAMYYLGWNHNSGMYYTTYTYGNLDEVYTYAAPTTLSAGLAPGNTTLQLTSTAGCSPLPVYGNLYGVRIGTAASGDTVFGTLAGSTLTIYLGLLGNTWASGAVASCVAPQHQSAIATPPVASVYRWASFFPAMAVDLGVPDVTGLNHGYRMGPEAPWAAASTFSPNTQVTDLWRRDFTNGIVLMRGWAYPGSWNEIELDNPPSHFSGGHPVCIQGVWPTCTGGPWYPLFADGTTGPGTQSVDLRESEAAILLTAPKQ